MTWSTLPAVSTSSAPTGTEDFPSHHAACRALTTLTARSRSPKLVFYEIQADNAKLQILADAKCVAHCPLLRVRSLLSLVACACCCCVAGMPRTTSRSTRLCAAVTLSASLAAPVRMAHSRLALCGSIADASRSRFAARSSKGELSIIPNTVTLLTPCLHNLPSQIIGVKDQVRPRPSIVRLLCAALLLYRDQFCLISPRAPLALCPPLMLTGNPLPQAVPGPDDEHAEPPDLLHALQDHQLHPPLPRRAVRACAHAGVTCLG